ncbi:MAG: hypothetical protein II453_02895 [Alphaproteobacteria bacterium]|jgi:hypothetical protein|nr:hypothetical protein [Alphaproteobacteria bacterium]
MQVGEKMVTGKKKKYFLPTVDVKELLIKEDYVIAVEFDNTDMTEKVRFLNGDAVQAFAVCDTDEELRAAFKKFLEYTKKYWELRAKTDPLEKELQAKYVEMYHDFVDPEFGQIIKDRHDPEKVIAEYEKKQKEKEQKCN